MALFTDGPASTMEDLAAQDSQLMNVASAEGIDVTAKIALNQEAIGLELEELLARSDNFALSQVVVTPALRLWHTYRTLEFVYRDAYNSQLNDRYAGKRDQFRELSQWAQNRLIQAGIGVVTDPVPLATGFQAQPGTGTMPPGVYYVATSWVNAAGEEGACSGPIDLEAPDGAFAVYPPAPPDGTTGWNVYAGLAPETMTRQNDSPLNPGAPWLPEMLTTYGARPGRGQQPNQMQAIPRMLQRG